MRPLIIIPARGGSKGVPKKNIKLLGGKPLIIYTIEAAREVAAEEAICVSTDSREIADVVESAGLKVPFVRPQHLATDEAGMDDVIFHALDSHDPDGAKYDTIILLQPTSPFRNEVHIQEAMNHLTADVDMVVSVKLTSSNPYYILFEENPEGFLESSKKMENLRRRQDAPEVYELNGAIYVFKVSKFKQAGSLSAIARKVKYVMSDLDSVDIDSELDWEFAESLLQKRSLKS